jgi:hypothetical protein
MLHGTHLSYQNQIREMKRVKSNRDFNRKTSINTMLIIEINTINIKSLQATLTSFSHIAWITTDLIFLFNSSDSKFCSQINFLSHSLQSLFHNFQTSSKFTIIYNFMQQKTNCNNIVKHTQKFKSKEKLKG